MYVVTTSLFIRDLCLSLTGKTAPIVHQIVAIAIIAIVAIAIIASLIANPLVAIT